MMVGWNVARGVQMPLTRLALACGVALASVGAQAVSVPRSFYGDEIEAGEQGWRILNDAYLTAGTQPARTEGNVVFPKDTAGSGWLRLTDNWWGRRGAAIYDVPFPSTDGIQATFTYASYGRRAGLGADGFTFYLIDGDVKEPTTGASDGSLGYSSWYHGPKDVTSGVKGGYVGVGFDEYGNYSHGNYGGCRVGASRDACPPLPNSIAVRGAGNEKSDFPLLITVPNVGIETSNVENATPEQGRAAAHDVRITITPAPDVKLTVEMDSNDGRGFVKYVDAFDIESVNGTPPATFKLGFSGGTGGYNNYHEIRFDGIGGARAATIKLDASSAPQCGYSNFQAHVTGSDRRTKPTGIVSFKTASGTKLGDATLDANGLATLRAYLPADAGDVIAEYMGDEVYGHVEDKRTQPGAPQCGTVMSFVPTAAMCSPLGLSARILNADGVPTLTDAPIGEVEFSIDGGAVLGRANVDQDGWAKLDGVMLTGGNYRIVANYLGDEVHAPISSSISQSVTSSCLAASISFKPVSAPVCGTSRLEATVSGASGVPTGVVTFAPASNALPPYGAAELDGTGKAVLAGVSLPEGQNLITASYGGDAVYGAFTSEVVSQVGAPACTVPGDENGPGTGPGTDPGTSPGTDPGTGPGTGPGTNPGTDPGTSPGTGPGTSPGTDPGTNPGNGGQNPGGGLPPVGGNPVPGNVQAVPASTPLTTAVLGGLLALFGVMRTRRNAAGRK